jgi:vacuolar-type H+-ATPase subunit D/Vma8
VDRLYELERMRRSIAMLQPGTKALDREEAMRLIAELQEVEGRMRALRESVRGVMERSS